MTLVPLSAIDHLYANASFDPIPIVLYYDAPLDAKRLEAAFWEATAAFPGVSGTLGLVAENTLAFDLSRTSAVFRVVRAKSGQRARDLVEPLRTELGGPLACAYVVDLPDNRTAVGLSLAHVVADGYGYFLFLASWAAHARGLRLPAPNCDRSVLTDAGAFATRAAPANPGVLPRTQLVLLEKDHHGPRLRMEERWLERSVVGQPGPGLSENDLLCAQLWQEAAKADADLTTFVCYVDLRRHVPALGPLFFGNAILPATVRRSHAEIMRASVADIAGWIRDAVNDVPHHVPECVAELEQLRGNDGLQAVARLRTFPPTGFTITNMSRAPLPHLDFGAGAPADVEIAQQPPRAQGALVLPSRADRIRLLVATP